METKLGQFFSFF